MYRSTFYLLFLLLYTLFTYWILSSFHWSWAVYAYSLHEFSCSNNSVIYQFTIEAWSLDEFGHIRHLNYVKCTNSLSSTSHFFGLSLYDTIFFCMDKKSVKWWYFVHTTFHHKRIWTMDRKWTFISFYFGHRWSFTKLLWTMKWFGKI